MSLKFAIFEKLFFYCLMGNWHSLGWTLGVSAVVGLYFIIGFWCYQVSRNWQCMLREENYTRLCNTKSILTVNGEFPGPTLHVNTGDTFVVDVINRGNYNVTLHWHGVTMMRNSWHDGPEYITQCPIPAGGRFRQKVILGPEEGTLWWHAHSNWTRATVHGAIVISPKPGTTYPFPKPHAQIPIILGEWWKMDIQTMYYTFVKSGGDPNVSDAFLINGQPGDLYNCSKQDTFKLKVDHGKTYLLRLINTVMQQILFFGVANHNLTVVGSDASYVKPFVTDYIAISPGQTVDVLLEANQRPNRYYMAAKAYERTPRVPFDTTITTGLVVYNGHYTPSTPPALPKLPLFNDTGATISYTKSLKSLACEDHPVEVPMDIDVRLFYTLSINSFPCEVGRTCEGPNNTRLASSINNVTFISPTVDLLEAYNDMINGQFMTDFPDNPPLKFNYTTPVLPLEFEVPKRGTKVKVLEYNSTVELIFQGTSVVAPADHPMHLHGYSFYVVGSGLGNFDMKKDPLNYNLIDPPYQNTIVVPYAGWTAIRFKANNPGVWFMHCHLDRHASWGMEMAFIVKNGKTSESRLLHRPKDMPRC